MMATPRNPALTSPFNLFLLGLLFVVGVAYTLIGFSTQDLLWFWPVFDQQPSQIIIRCHGTETLLEQSSPQFLRLTHLVEQQISGEKWLDDVKLSGDVYHQLKSSHIVATLEIHFSHPVRIHSHRSYFSDVDTLLYVLGGKTDRWVNVYSIEAGQPSAGRLRVAGNSLVADYLSQEEFCLDPSEGE